LNYLHQSFLAKEGQKMLTSIQTTLTEISTRFADKRTQLCQLEGLEDDNGRFVLQGKVLDSATLTAVTHQLQSQFSNITIDHQAVIVLRQPIPRQLAVTTTITGLYNTPGFRSEMGSELLNGVMVEILQEEGSWLFVRQADGYLGWVYRPYLGDVPGIEATHLVCEPVALLKNAPEPEAPLVNRVLVGTAVVSQTQREEWHQIELAGGQTGWLNGRDVRLLTSFPSSISDQRQQLIADAYRFIGIPYLWAGISGYGIDCSGYVQALHRLCGITLPRDADMQYKAGRVVDTPYQPGDLLFFGSDQGHRRISHVGMSLGGWQMIHASRSRNGVFVDDVQTVDHLRETFMGARSFLTSVFGALWLKIKYELSTAEPEEKKFAASHFC
jgi:cell wall-associated NlpC family hydrolase